MLYQKNVAEIPVSYNLVDMNIRLGAQNCARTLKFAMLYHVGSLLTAKWSHLLPNIALYVAVQALCDCHFTWETANNAPVLVLSLLCVAIGSSCLFLILRNGTLHLLLGT